MSRVFCDWLNVTYKPEDSQAHAVTRFLQNLGAYCQHEGIWRFPLGSTVAIDAGNARFHRICFSGGVLAMLRELGEYANLLSLLSCSPRRITRLDAALDTDEKGPQAVGRLRASYPRDVQLSHKPIAVQSLLSLDRNGQETGTWYAGHRSRARVTARVYDKAHQMLEKFGQEWPPTTRYEITLKADVSPSLRDAWDPTPAFWHYASPALLQKPEGVPEWEPWGEGWMSDYEEPLVAQTLKRRVGNSPDIDALLDLADQCGENGRLYLMALIRRRLGLQSPRQEAEALAQFEGPPKH